MAVICHCPNCLGEVLGRFQGTCLVCGREIPLDLRMSDVPALEASTAELRRTSTLQTRILAGVARDGRPSAWPEPAPFEEPLEERDADEPREMDWEDDDPVEPPRRRRWFRR
jgi:hypothetical protein